MFDLSLNFISGTEVQIVDTTDYTGETISNIDVTLTLLSDTTKTVTFTYFNEDIEIEALTRVLNETASFTLNCTDYTFCSFPDGAYEIKFNYTLAEDVFCHSLYIFKNLDLIECKKKLINKVIKEKLCGADCSSNCDILLFNTILSNIEIETQENNFPQVNILHEHLTNICNDCKC